MAAIIQGGRMGGGKNNNHKQKRRAVLAGELLEDFDKLFGSNQDDSAMWALTGGSRVTITDTKPALLSIRLCLESIKEAEQDRMPTDAVDWMMKIMKEVVTKKEAAEAKEAQDAKGKGAAGKSPKESEQWRVDFDDFSNKIIKGKLIEGVGTGKGKTFAELIHS